MPKEPFSEPLLSNPFIDVRRPVRRLFPRACLRTPTDPLPPLTTSQWMDFQGQVLAEHLYHAIIVVPSAIGFLHGYFARNFMVTFYWWLAGAALAMVLTVPSWACLFRRNGVEWADEREEREKKELEAKEEAAEANEASGGGGSSGGKKKK